MLSVWRGVKGIIYWELLPNRYTVTPDLYCQQLDRVAQKLKAKKDRFYFLHDNARSHVAKSTRKKLFELGWITIPHPPYSPDLTPTDCHLFRSLPSHLREKKFADEVTSKRTWQTFLAKSLWSFTNAGSFLYQSVGDWLFVLMEHISLKTSVIFERKK